MAETKAPAIDVQSITSTLTNVAYLAENILSESLQFCAQKMGLPMSQAIVDLVQNGDPSACQYWHYGLAKQVAEQLGTWDESVKAVYVCDYDATPEDLCFGEATPPSLLHLLVWVDRKTAALAALVETLHHALVQCCAEQMDRPKLAHLLDVQIVDDAEVENRIGYGAMLSSLYNRPVQVWQR